MTIAEASGEQLALRAAPHGRRAWRHAALVAPGLVAVGLMVLWAEHDGGYDPDTWYWGALLLLALLAATVVGLGSRRATLSRPALIALAAFTAYTAWSYVSIAWAQDPGSALQGSNRTLLYLLLFTLLLILPWTPEAALGALLLFVLGVGAVGLVILARLAAGDHVQDLLIQGRLVAPTGYFNSSAALFMIEALLGVGLAVRRELPAPLRGALVALSCAALQLSVMGQSRGWLFTLPLVVLAVAGIVRNRIRFAVAAVIPVVATLAPIHLLLDVSHGDGAALQHGAARAGGACLLICAVACVAGTLITWWEARIRTPRLARPARLTIGAAIGAVVLAGAGAGALVATHGHPVSFISRQWRGLSHVQTTSQGSTHFAAAGSGRYDFWRVSLGALSANPIGGLGQDNFADYYVTHRRTREEPSSPHSLEMSLAAETGLVGSGLFVAFIAAAIAAALRARRAGSDLSRGVAATALLPLVVWLIHGSVDWFWEMPALSGPALAFVAIAAALARPSSVAAPKILRGRSVPRAPAIALGAVALAAAVVVLGFPYLSVREVSVASNLRQSNPGLALDHLTTASELNPLSADPGRIGGTIALETGSYLDAQRRFAQASSREPGGWFSWLGAGLAASALGNRSLAHHDLELAAAINRRQPVVRRVLKRLYRRHPLMPDAALAMLVLVH
jgi:hypothetical protein